MADKDIRVAPREAYLLATAMHGLGETYEAKGNPALAAEHYRLAEKFFRHRLQHTLAGQMDTHAARCERKAGA